MNLHLSIVSYSEDNQQLAVDYQDMEPMRFNTPLILATSTKSASIGVSIYVVPTAGPDTTAISDTPDFSVELSVFKNDQLLERKSLTVNCWGGMQRIGIRFA